MRERLIRFMAVVLMGVAGFSAQPGASAWAQTLQQTAAINQAVADAAGGNVQALTTFLQNNPGLATVVGNAVATQLNANAAGAANIANALVATGDVSLISGVMIAANITPAAQATLAGAVAQSGNAGLAAQVIKALQASGNAGALAAVTALNSAVAQQGGTFQQQVAQQQQPQTLPSPAQIVAGSPA